ncbi:virulence protein SciE type [Caulobacter flavus]|uniref:Virulence protein SciE type n=1 Tax=Caulobacter flavus TaxID=1679497 RepID=A0A2N5CZD9_9CAUL|nr:type VI secretion system accessory protein TagJ [Caulobacter flavus]AYV45141.1 virulence protein SciE type [Caulobacter flavus]PLR19179.1 virulence protein SciE type [Caulobacter flavus]
MRAQIVSAEERLDAGDILGARAALVETVRARPRDIESQVFLFHVMAIQGDWEKAAARLRAIVALDPAYRMFGLLYGAAIGAEVARAEVFAGRRPPDLLCATAPWTEAFVAAFAGALAGDPASIEARDMAADEALDVPGRWNDQDIDWIADTDDRLGPMLEAIVDGRWGLLPFEAVAELRSEGPRHLRDLIWLPAHVTLRSGERAAALLPTRYPGTEMEPDDTLKLARQTIWKPGAGGVTAAGQRVLTGGEEIDLDLLSLRSLVMAA